MKKALVTGVTGQDGSYLAELLLDKGYSVDGLVRRLSTPNMKNLDLVIHNPHFNIIEGDVEDATKISGIIAHGHYHEVYNLAAQSFVQYSFENPVATSLTNYLGAFHLIEAIRRHSPTTKFYQASTSEMYGGLSSDAYNEESAFHPRSPYGTAKLGAYWHTRNAREAYDLFACNGILFNHESPRRGIEFVTQKICQGVRRYRKWWSDATYEISGGMPPVLTLGNLDAMRDWGHAKDYVRGMWLMMQHDTPDDYVLATGQAYSIRDFVEKAFKYERGFPPVALPRAILQWRGEGMNETGVVCGTHGAREHVAVAIDEKYYRPSEVPVLLGDASKAKRILGWEPEYTFDQLVQDMLSC